MPSSYEDTHVTRVRHYSGYATPGQLRVFYPLLAIALLAVLALGFFGVYPAEKAYEKTQVGKPVVMEER